MSSSPVIALLSGRHGLGRVIGGLAILALVWLLSACTPPRSDELVVARALAVAADTPVFPEHLPATIVALPDDWAVTRPGHVGTVWYRVSFDAPEGRAPLALHIGRACRAVLVVLNGQRLADSSGSSPHGHCQRPQVIELPASLLQARANHLDLKLAGDPLARVAMRTRAAGLGPLSIGPAAMLSAGAVAAPEFWQETLPKMTAVALALLGTTTLVIGWLTTRRSYLLWFALLSFGWAALSATVWLAYSGLPGRWQEWVISALMPLIAATAVLFLMRYAGLPGRSIDYALAAQCLIAPASVALAGEDRLFVAVNAWNALLAAEVAVAAGAALWRAWRVQRREFWILLAMLSIIGLAVLSELAAQQRWFLESSPPLLRLAMPIAFVAVGLRMLQIEVASLRMSDAEVRELLDKRVHEATAAAERDYAALAEQRIEQVTQRERKRIAADLHDDLGAKLLTIVHTSDNDRISSLAREALEEMRLSVRGLTGKPVRLADALGDWRAEVVSRLAQANIGADWQSGDEELPQTLPARSYVQTTRILREAVSNIIKHSGAQRCTIATRVQDGDFVLTIKDNGAGIPMELDGQLDRGHGMASMKQRAKQLQGQCLVESGPGFGTVIRLTVPL